MTAKYKIQAELWFNGPVFLWQHEEAWPLRYDMKKSEIQCHTVTKEIDFMYIGLFIRIHASKD